MTIRQPIITVCGHVDCGKTTFLDSIRGSNVAEKESGGITQHIGATEVPVEVIQDIGKDLIKKMNLEIKIPGLLFIDTPGHEAFSSLRKRGGSIADIACLIIDINEGFKPQTYESLEILKQYKTPFIVIANKVDRINLWQETKEKSMTKALMQQSDECKALIDKKVYEIVGILHEKGFASELYSRVTDFTKEIMIVPMSAKTGEGLAEVLTFLTGISQKFLEHALQTEVTGPGKGTVLEVKDEIGFGKTIDVILYDGVIKTGDTVILGGFKGPIETKVRALLKPKPLEEIRAPNERFKVVKEVQAAAGLKIAAPGLEDALPGSPIYVSTGPQTKQQVEDEIEQITFDTQANGITIKADALGSLEALVKLLSAKGIKIHSASVGNVNKKDVTEALSVRDQDKYVGLIFAFNVKVEDNAALEARKNEIKILQSPIVYRLLEEYEEWLEKEKEKEQRQGMKNLVLPAKITLLPGHVFRNTKPVIVGVKVETGTLQVKAPLMKEDGTFVGKVKSIKSQSDTLQELKKGEEAAISIQEPIVVGRHIFEGDKLYTQVPREHYYTLKKEFSEFLKKDEVELLDEIMEIARKGGNT